MRELLYEKEVEFDLSAWRQNKIDVKNSHNIGDALYAIKSLLSKAGVCSSILTSKSMATEKKSHLSWEEILSRYFNDPVSFENIITWLLYQTLMVAQIDFAKNKCRAPAQENVLVGALDALMTSTAREFNKEYNKIFDEQKMILVMDRMDMSIGGGEQINGADFAIILDIENVSDCSSPKKNGGPRFVPLLFQAKKYSGEDADVSQHNENTGYQLDKLTSNKCESAYIFFENDNNRKIDAPKIPMVKSARDVKHPTKTNVNEDTLDFATYVLKALDRDSEYAFANSRIEAVRMLYKTANLDRLQHIVLLGDNERIRERFEKVEKEIAKSLKNQKIESERFVDEPEK